MSWMCSKSLEAGPAGRGRRPVLGSATVATLFERGVGAEVTVDVGKQDRHAGAGTEEPCRAA